MNFGNTEELDICVIAGGLGLRSSYRELPKSLHPINNSPLIQFQLELFNRTCKSKVNFVTNYKSEMIEKYLKNNRQNYANLNISVTKEVKAKGTLAAAKLHAIQTKSLYSIYVLGDLFINIDLKKIYLNCKKLAPECAILTHPNDHLFDSDRILYDPFSHKFVACAYKGTEIKSPGYQAIAGIFIIKNSWLREIPDFDEDLSHTLLKQGLKFDSSILCHPITGLIKDMGTPARLNAISSLVYSSRVPKITKIPVIFIDLDNTLIDDQKIKKSFSTTIKLSILDSIKYANSNDVPIFIVTNQPGIAKGFFSIDDFLLFKSEFEGNLDAHKCFINDWFICPHHPDQGWDGEIVSLKVICDCRKPKTGLIKQAMFWHDIELSKSIFIGDSIADEQMCKNLNLKFFKTMEFKGSKKNQMHSSSDTGSLIVKAVNNIAHIKNSPQG